MFQAPFTILSPLTGGNYPCRLRSPSWIFFPLIYCPICIFMPIFRAYFSYLKGISLSMPCWCWRFPLNDTLEVFLTCQQSGSSAWCILPGGPVWQGLVSASNGQHPFRPVSCHVHAGAALFEHHLEYQYIQVCLIHLNCCVIFQGMELSFFYVIVYH